MTLNPATLAAIGTSLYGGQWQSPLARDLGVATRTVQRWARGQFEPPPGVWQDVAAICEDRGKTLLAWADELDPLPPDKRSPEQREADDLGTHEQFDEPD